MPRPRVQKSCNELNAAKASSSPKIRKLASAIESGKAEDLQDAWVKQARGQI